MSELILVVESAVGACRGTRRCLEQAGFGVRVLSQQATLQELQQSRPSLIILDEGKQSNVGVEFCRRIRHTAVLQTLPVILLSGAGQEDRILGLEAGADDCVAEPSNPRELLARVQSLLRRSPRFPGNTGRPESTDIVIDRAAMKLSVRGTEVVTTTLEFRLLDYLAVNRGRVFTRDLLLDAVWGEMQFLTPRTVDTCVRRVRDKIEPDRARPTYLKTVRGVGYRFDAIASWPEG